MDFIFYTSTKLDVGNVSLLKTKKIFSTDCQNISLMKHESLQFFTNSELIILMIRTSLKNF